MEGGAGRRRLPAGGRGVGLRQRAGADQRGRHLPGPGHGRRRRVPPGRPRVLRGEVQEDHHVLTESYKINFKFAIENKAV